MIRKILSFTLVISLLVLIMPSTSLANGNYDLKYVDGSNLILVTYNGHAPVSGIETEHNVRLYDLIGAPIPFSTVHIEIVKGSTSAFDATLKSTETNDVTFNYVYPKAGKYTLKATFSDNGKDVSSGEMAVEVTKGANQSFWATAFTSQTLVALLLGIGLASAYFMRKQIMSERHIKKVLTKLRKK